VVCRNGNGRTGRSSKGFRRCASLVGDLEELKLVGCDERSRELNFRRVTKEGARKCQNQARKNYWRESRS
jgi:hypothetical protein